MELLSVTLSSFLAQYRTNHWFYHKLQPVMAISYAQMLFDGNPFSDSVRICIVLLVCLAGCAAYGYIVNDTFDIEQDYLAGKENRMRNVPAGHRFLLSALAVLFGFMPFFVGHLSGQAALVLLAIYIIATLYSARPFRLKERGLLGVLADATAAHVLPILLVFSIFSDLGESFSIAALIWAFFTGLRAITMHQLWDQENDIRAGALTFLRQAGPVRVQFAIRNLIFPAEITSFLIVLFLIGRGHPSLFLVAGAYAASSFLMYYFGKRSFDPVFRPKGLHIFPYDFYETWFPFYLLILLTFENPQFLLLLLMHFVLFYKVTRRRFVELGNLFRSALKTR